MGVLFGIAILFFGGIGAILFSILSWRLRENIYFVLGLIFTALIFIYLIINIEYVIGLLMHPDSTLFGIITVALFIIPAVFLFLSKQKKSHGTHESEVTESYLDEIINSEDEEIDYE